jgi:putative transposase
MKAIDELSSEVGTAAACRSLSVPRATLYRHRRPMSAATLAPPPPRRPSPRALSPEERQGVLDVLHSEPFLDQAPAEVYAALLDQGRYLCSIRTMYRILETRQEIRERRDQLRHPNYPKPQLLATAPRQVWSWDITKLLGPVKWTYFHLYVILDIFSRYVVGWMLAHRESDDLAERLIRETIVKEGILCDGPGDGPRLTIHSDRGPAMRSQTVAQLLATLGVTKSHSRPHVSDDNPYSESQFKTMKYRPEFPDRFVSYDHGLSFCGDFFHWHNFEHHHWGLGLLTPAVVHHGQAKEILTHRQMVLDAVHTAHPERFVRRPPQPLQLPDKVWINPPTDGLEPRTLQLPCYTKFPEQLSHGY